MESTWGYEQVDLATVNSNSMFSVIDTGSSAINFSTLYYEDFINKIFEKVGGTEYQF